MKKVFITGANGFLGSHLIDRLLEKGDEVHALVRSTSNLRWLKGKKVQFHYGDVTGDLKGLREGLHDVDIVYHVAGVIRARKKEVYYKVNVEGTENVLKSCLEICPTVSRVVIVTSIAAHGPNPGSHSMRENDACQPLTDYGKSKYEAERVAFRYQEQLPITFVRPPAIYGPRDEQILDFFKMVQKGLMLLPGREEKILNLCYVQDVVSGMILSAESPKGVGQVFFIAADQNYPWKEISQIVSQVMEKKPITLSIPSSIVWMVATVMDAWSVVSGKTYSINRDYVKNFLQPNWAVDITKANKALGYQPAYSLEKGIRATVEWYKKEGWL